jgi:hypothetical protein
MKPNKVMLYMGRVANSFEFVIAALLLLVIAIRVVEIVFAAAGSPVEILNMDFDRLLSVALTIVIGVEFTKMLCRHTPETVIDVLLFAIARQTIIYHEGTMDMLMGAVSIIGLFAAKRFLLDKLFLKKKEEDAEPGE